MTAAAPRPYSRLATLSSAPRRGILRTFPALRESNYRLYVTSQLLTNPGGWMQRIAQDWLILQLSGNVALVGLTVTLQLGPMLLFGLWGGVLADRYNKRAILMVTQSIFAASALALGVLVVTGLVQPWHILLSAFILGLATVPDNPARQAFVVEVAGPENLRNAISLNSTVFQLGGLIGPAIAGIAIAAFGEGPAFLANSAAGVIAVLLLTRMNAAKLHPAPRVAREPGQLRAGLQHVGQRPEILWTIVLIGLVALTGINLATVLSAYADNVFRSGAGGYGLLSAAVAAGAVIGSIASARRVRVGLRQLVYLAMALGALQVVAALISVQALFVVVLVAVGAVSLYYLTGGNTLIQTTVSPTMRGRVMAVYIMVFFGAQAISGTLIGFVADHAGAQVAMIVTGMGPLLGAAIVGSILAHARRLRPRLIIRERPGRGFVYVRPRELHRAA
ncbi:MFS transporter [Pseudactinotalea sp.]|uniref:MFS transporter n=1 Tax=Pseudactinotalea sp. TaxID=1926260 RepID=UPI003B3B861F